MKTIIYYYTGSGNSLWTARTIKKELSNAELHPMSLMNGDTMSDAEAVGLVFPVHMWGIPGLVINFISKLKKDPNRYYFAFAVNAGQVSRTLVQLKNLMAAYGLQLSIGIDIVLPSNYIPWGGPGPAEKMEKRYTAAKERIRLAAKEIRDKKNHPVEKGPIWQRILFTAMYKMTYKQIHKMDSKFFADEKCNSCGTCEKICPVGNIAMHEGRPVWQHRCEQCLACIQWCPKEAIQYGKKTAQYERYHHPEVKLKDMMVGKNA